MKDLLYFLDTLYKERPFKKVLLSGGSYSGALVAWFAENYAELAKNRGVKNLLIADDKILKEKKIY